jgi:hypothetical protein
MYNLAVGHPSSTASYQNHLELMQQKILENIKL